MEVRAAGFVQQHPGAPLVSHLSFHFPSCLTQFCPLTNSFKLGKGVKYELKRQVLDWEKDPSSSGTGNGWVKSPSDFQDFKSVLFVPLPASDHSPPFSVSPPGLLHTRFGVHHYVHLAVDQTCADGFLLCSQLHS